MVVLSQTDCFIKEIRIAGKLDLNHPLSQSADIVQELVLLIGLCTFYVYSNAFCIPLILVYISNVATGLSPRLQDKQENKHVVLA